jgi:SAM-dependent methyltransferase
MKSMKSTVLPIKQQAKTPVWPIRLFNKSVLKQKKYREIVKQLGETHGMDCLDIGSDNGVISYLLRQRGGRWKSADLDEGSVRAITELVKTDVYQIDGGITPFDDGEFDKIVIVDFLEHIEDDLGFINDLYRILKPGGVLIINTPHLKDSWLRKFRFSIGQTDEKHGHLRPGYTVEKLTILLKDRFTIGFHSTYSKFFSEAIDTLIVYFVSVLRKGKEEPSKKGVIITGQDLKKYKSSFKLYSMIYPVVWLFSKLDTLLFFRSGYMLIAKAVVNEKENWTS